MPRPVANPPNPWHTTVVELLEPATAARLQVYEEATGRILAENDSPDIPFRYSLNPYRGCFHGCSYCYARPTHQWLDLGAGTDFDRRIVVKTQAPERLRAMFLKKSWTGEPIAFSGNTDCYQPLEASYELTRRCLEVCAEFRNPVRIITKATLVRRDVDLLVRLREEADVRVVLSIPFARDEDARALEPYAPPPSKRFDTLRFLAEAGVPVGVSLAPVIPGLTDSQIPDVLARAAEAGAGNAFISLVRLAPEVEPGFEARLRETFPLRADKILSTTRAMRQGSLHDRLPGRRMRGEGPRWQAVVALFEAHARRLGLTTGCAMPDRAGTFRRPERQGRLFD